MAVPAGPRRLLFYSHDEVGLGHLTRVLPVVHEVARRRPETAILLVAGSPDANSFPLPRDTDLLRLPDGGKYELYAGVPPDADPEARAIHSWYTPPSGVWAVRERLIAAAFASFAPDLVFVEHLPAGAHREAALALDRLWRSGRRVRTVLNLHDVMDQPAAFWAWWRRGGQADLVSRYDRLVVPGDRRVFDPVTEYRFPSDWAAKTVFTGYAVRRAPSGDAAALRGRLGAQDKPLVLAMAGSGASGADILRAVISALRAAPPLGVAAVVLTGPRMEETDRSELEALAAGLSGVTVTAFDPEPLRYVAAADLIVTMGGPSSIAEALAHGKRTVVVPRLGPWREQALRARSFAAAGLVRLVRPDEATPERLRAEMAAALADAPPPSWLDCDGASRTVDVIEELLAGG